MNEYLSKMMSIQRDIEKNSKMQTIFRCIAAMCVFMVFVCSFNPDTAMNIAFVVSIPAVAAMFVLDANYANKSHSLEVDLYLVQLEHLKNEKKAAEEKGEELSSTWMESIDKPAEKAPLPIVYYCVLLVIDIVIWII